MAAALMAGNAQSALDHAGQLDGKVADEIAAEIGWIQLMKQAPYFAHAHLSDPRTILALEDPGDAFPFVRAMWHYARGVAYAREGALQEARREATRIDEIRKDAGASYPADIAPAVPQVLEIARHVVEGRIAQAAGDWQRAIEEFGTAVEIQDALPYLEPPFWYYPVRQSLGAAQLQAGRPEEAVATFEEALLRVPNNGWALFGLMEAQKAEGDLAAAAATERLLEQAWAGERSRLELSRL